MPEYQNILALYDCRSKQEYIYRTNRVKEIAGASCLLADLFMSFFEDKKNGFRINAYWKQTAPENYLEYFNSSGLDAEIVYEGGGNLCVIYKDKETYIRINQALSRTILERTFGVSIIASAALVTDNFVQDRKNLYLNNAVQKNLGAYHTPCNVLPFTQVDRLTYQPIIKKEDKKQYTTESLKKLNAYHELFHKKEVTKSGSFQKMFDDMTDKGNDSILAIIYIDGNNMGSKVKKITENKTDYTSGINALREFSQKTNQDFVENPIQAITAELERLYQANEGNKKEQIKYLFRPIISGGDEITIVCNAHAVPEILKVYFETLTSGSDNSACAGVALFHSHAPFADVYRIAEECCESGKAISHLEGNENKNYIDFHFCHAGITNSLEEIRNAQESGHTARPYEYASTWKDFIRCGEMTAGMKRADIKDLGEAIVKGDSYYAEEIRRIKSRNKNGKFDEIYQKADELKKYLFDISVIFDLWFAGKEKKTDE
ncbi:MAG: hypothetical protein IJ644_09010 [Oscillospiraceae bacterium]|nr:hypothetical protein [Oscillospiraceae bacterium]